MTINEQVKQKLTLEYEEYMARVRLMSKEDIISRVDVIADMTEVYYYLTSDDYEFTDYESKHLLTLDKPLDMIASWWKDNDKDISEGVDHTVWEICDRVIEDEDEYEP